MSRGKPRFGPNMSVEPVEMQEKLEEIACLEGT
jgi:hypothetical protein